MPVRPALPRPVMVPRSSYYQTSARHDYGIDDSINRIEHVSNAVLEDTYDAARRSKGKDNDLLRSTRAAIVSTEQHVSPKASAVSRRVRASTVPPRPAQVQQSPSQLSSYTKVEEASHQYRPRVVVVPATSSVSNINYNTGISRPVVLRRGGSVPPPEFGNCGTRAASLPPRAKKASTPAPVVDTSNLCAHRPVPLYRDVLKNARASSKEPEARRASNHHSQRSVEERVNPSALETSRLWAHRPVALRKDAVRMARARTDERENRLRRADSEPRSLDKASDYYYSIPQVKERALTRYLYAQRGNAQVNPKRVSFGDFPLVYVPWKGPGPSNRAKAAIIGSRLDAECGAKKPPKRPRSEFAAKKLREFKFQDIEEGANYRNPVSSGVLQSSKSPLPKPTDRKAIRDVDGLTKPRNIMSWQYRVESRLNPDDLIYQPSSYIRLREQVRNVQEKMDRQRQLLDRYLDTEFTSSSATSRNYGGSEGSNSAGGDPDNRPVSDLRRKLRRTIARTKNNPDYYRE